MKLMRSLAILPFLVVACGDDGNSGGNDATNTNDTNNNPNCQVDPGVSALTGVNTNVTPAVTNPNPNNNGCTGSVNGNTTGARYPWGGEEVEGRNYTCNGCPFGFEHQGTYRLHGWSKDDGSPCGSLQDADCHENFSTPKANEFNETVWLDGNTFRIHQKNGVDPRDLEVWGYIFCGMKPEGPNEHTVWVIVDAAPDNVEGMMPGDFLETGKLHSGGDGGMTAFWYDALNSAENDKSETATYCKYGKTDKFGNACADPFNKVPCN